MVDFLFFHRQCPPCTFAYFHCHLYFAALGVWTIIKSQDQGLKSYAMHSISAFCSNCGSLKHALRLYGFESTRESHEKRKVANFNYLRSLLKPVTTAWGVYIFVYSVSGLLIGGAVGNVNVCSIQHCPIYSLFLGQTFVICMKPDI